MPKIVKRLPQDPDQPKGSDRWRTPLPCYQALDQEFAFCLDLAADQDNHLHPYWLGPGSPLGVEDALTVTWAECVEPAAELPWGFLNSPYSSQLIKEFLEATVENTQVHRFGVAALLPDTHDTRWYRHLKWASEIRRIPHRVGYLKADGVTATGAMFPSCVAIFRPQPGVWDPLPRVVTWTWKVREER